MAENPLLPNRRLQELHALMLRCRELDSQQRFAAGLSREAYLAATAIHVEAGDVLCGESKDATAATLTGQNKRSASSKKKIEEKISTPSGAHLSFCSGLARGLQLQANKNVVFAFVTSGVTDAGWAEALRYAQQARLPLVIVCADVAGEMASSTDASSLHLTAVNRIAKPLHLPVLTVDGEDAVAMYRVIQESALRARTGDGPAVVWCFLTSRQRSKSGISKPITHMEQYLTARGLKPLKASA